MTRGGAVLPGAWQEGVAQEGARQAATAEGGGVGATAQIGDRAGAAPPSNRPAFPLSLPPPVPPSPSFRPSLRPCLYLPPSLCASSPGGRPEPPPEALARCPPARELLAHGEGTRSGP